MSNKKYPIGTRIKFINACCEKGQGKQGRIVGIARDFPVIFVTECECISCFSTLQCPASVQCSWSNIEPSLLKNQQLLFDFAY